jgi:phosphotransferase system HPr (HPr) family protein
VVEETARVELQIVNPQGLHARPSSMIVRTAMTYDAIVRLSIDGRTADCKSIMEVMMLASPQGTPLVIEARGPQAQAAVKALSELIRAGFHEG